MWPVSQRIYTCIYYMYNKTKTKINERYEVEKKIIWSCLIFLSSFKVLKPNGGSAQSPSALVPAMIEARKHPESSVRHILVSSILKVLHVKQKWSQKSSSNRGPKCSCRLVVLDFNRPFSVCWRRRSVESWQRCVSISQTLVVSQNRFGAFLLPCPVFE